MKKLLIFGVGDIAELAFFYFNNDSEYSVEGFCLDKNFRKNDEFCGLPLIDFEDIQQKYDTNAYSVFIALSYTKMNDLRSKKVAEAKLKGYRIASYVSSRATIFSDFNCGDNCFILENNTIQPFVKIGENVTLWSGNHIGHHSVIKNNCFISSHVVISGGVIVGENCFVGVNATVNDHIEIGDYSLIASGALINKNTTSYGVFVGAPFKMRDGIKSTDLKL